ncbi:MAG: hypothetical protein L0220_27930 [Acidobacteria bacterium]|nr:hypothetical protein [Acidobacteriota bacterium]
MKGVNMRKEQIINRNQTHFFGIALALMIVSILPSVQAQEKYPFEGIWNANLAKSQRHENHQFKSATMKFEVSDNLVLLTFTGINMAGKEESGTSRIHPDGKEHPVTESPGVVTISKWATSHRLELIARKGGSVVGESNYEVSKDGKMLTATVKGVDAKGRPFEQIIIFDRESK